MNKKKLSCCGNARLLLLTFFKARDWSGHILVTSATSTENPAISPSTAGHGSQYDTK